MPGFSVSNFRQKRKPENCYPQRCSEGSLEQAGYLVAWSTLNKYMQDKTFTAKDGNIYILEGVILNKKELYAEHRVNDMAELLACLYEKKGDTFPALLRGSFSGGIYIQKEEKWLFFTDQIGTKPFYYYVSEEGKLACGTQIGYVSDIMKANDIPRRADRHGLSCTMVYGNFMDDATGIEGVKRLYPGDCLILQKGQKEIKTYYQLSPEKITGCSEQEYIDRMDRAFTGAVQRILDKDQEYGYKSIIDISGGVDSRMIAYTAHKLNCRNAVMLCYSQSGGREYRIAQQVANDLGYDFYFKSLDNGSCIFPLEQNVAMNNGSAIYNGITGGKDFLELLNEKMFGAELTGLLGDIYDGSMVVVDGEKKPYLDYPKFRFSARLPYDEYTGSDCLNRFENHELFWYYTRGMICGMSSFPIRQNFVEPFTPFGDVEFMEVYLSIPWDIRVNGKLLSRWMVDKYPKAADTTYAATGITLREEFTFGGKVKKLLKFFNQEVHRQLHMMHKGYAMNPFDYWCTINPQINRFTQKYYEENIERVKDPMLRQKVEKLFDRNGIFADRSLALTVLAYHKLFLD